MTDKRMLSLAKRWANNRVFSLSDGEAVEYHKRVLEMLQNGGWISVKDRLPLPEPPERERSNPGNTSANPYWQRVCAIADKQRAKGMAEYGQGLEDNPAGIVQRITYLEEELVDGLMYCEWIKDRLKGERIHE